jgi:DNA-binding HxlR family transcriptional regulator
LTQSDLLTRKNYGEVPPRVEYSLTALGEEAVKLIGPIASFGEGYLSFLQGRS